MGGSSGALQFAVARSCLIRCDSLQLSIVLTGFAYDGGISALSSGGRLLEGLRRPDEQHTRSATRC